MADNNVVGIDQWKKKKAEKEQSAPHRPIQQASVGSMRPGNGGLDENALSDDIFRLLIEAAETSENPEGNKHLPLLKECFRVEGILNSLGSNDISTKIQEGRNTIKNYTPEQVLHHLTVAGVNEVRRLPYFYKALLYKARIYIEEMKSKKE